MLISFVDTFSSNMSSSETYIIPWTLFFSHIMSSDLSMTSLFFRIYLFIYLLLLFFIIFYIFFEMVIVNLLWHGTNKLYTAHCLSFFCDMPERVLYGHLVIFLWHDTIVICVSFDVSNKGGASVADITKKKLFLIDGFKGTLVTGTNNTNATSSSPIIVEKAFRPAWWERMPESPRTPLRLRLLLTSWHIFLCIMSASSGRLLPRGIRLKLFKPVDS